MLLADPLSRICAPSSGSYDPSLPSKFQALCKYLPESIKNIKTIRLYANKDTAALSRHIQAWRKPTNPISQGRLGSGEFSDNSAVFFIGVGHAEKSLVVTLARYCICSTTVPLQYPIFFLRQVTKKL